MNQDIIMIIGIVSGLISALLQSGSYVFSRVFIYKHRNSFELVVYSQLIMGLFAAFTILPAMKFSSYPLTWDFFLGIFLCILTFAAGQYAFFQTLRELEASRLSSLLGLKIVCLALITTVFTDTPLHFLQWVAIILCSISAVGMNFTGGRITGKAIFWLILMLICYAVCDIIESDLILQMLGPNLIVNSTAVAALIYFILGILTLPFLLKYPLKLNRCKDAILYAVTWYSAVLLLFVCFGSIGPVFGNIIQASRGILSVLIGLWLLHLGYEHLEPRVGRQAWCRRFLMATVMICAMCLYAYAKMLVGK